MSAASFILAQGYKCRLVVPLSPLKKCVAARLVVSSRTPIARIDHTNLTSKSDPRRAYRFTSDRSRDPQPQSSTQIRLTSWFKSPYALHRGQGGPRWDFSDSEQSASQSHRHHRLIEKTSIERRSAYSSIGCWCSSSRSAITTRRRSNEFRVQGRCLPIRNPPGRTCSLRLPKRQQNQSYSSITYSGGTVTSAQNAEQCCSTNSRPRNSR
jgi:hypothetical protein